MSEVSYKDFKTGFTFKDIRQMLYLESKRKYESGQYMWITRHIVLGRWRQIKREMYEDELKYNKGEIDVE